MKTIRITLVLIGVIFLIQSLAFCESATLTDKQNGYSLRYPADWSAKTYPNSRDLVKGDISKGDEAGINIRINPIHQDSFEGFIRWFVGDFKSSMENHWKGKMTTIDKDYYSIAGRKSYVITFDFKKNNGERWIFKDYLVPKNNKEIFVFQGGVKYSKKDEYLPILDKIIKSLKIQ
jgi:hypothetical protein